LLGIPAFARHEKIIPGKAFALPNMEEGAPLEEGYTVRGPDGVEVVISFLPNNDILVRAPPPFVVRSETLEVLPTS